MFTSLTLTVYVCVAAIGGEKGYRGSLTAVIQMKVSGHFRKCVQGHRRVAH